VLVFVAVLVLCIPRLVEMEGTPGVKAAVPGEAAPQAATPKEVIINTTNSRIFTNRILSCCISASHTSTVPIRWLLPMKPCPDLPGWGKAGLIA
jgi:hypothetical protein